MPRETVVVKYARTACLSCRRNKRRCDKKLPSCDLCARKEVPCSYPARRGVDSTATIQHPTALTPDSLSSENNPSTIELELDPSDANANAIYFIAPQVFQQSRLELPRPTLPVSAEVSYLLGDISSIREVATTYFKHIHRWLPIVSQRSFFTYLLNPLAQRRTELSLLALSMKLCCTEPSSESGGGGVRTSLYRTVKQFHHEAEAAGVLSIYVLQAGILIALYELGHAIYPAAYLSVGVCARYGIALGVDKFCLAPVSNSDGRRSWNEIEEGRRVWWAVLMFDRFLSLSNPSRSLFTEDPTFETYLPVDDAAWDDCIANPGDAVRISNGFTLKMGSFARLAQATYLLSQALRSIKQTATEYDTSQPDGTAQLRRTLLALVNATDSEATVRRLEFCAQSALSLSAILLLQEHNLQKEDINAKNEQMDPSFENLWTETRTALDRLWAAAVSYNFACPSNPDAPGTIPIFVTHAMYQVGCIFLRLSTRTLDRENRDRIDTLRELLQIINSRWRVAGIYLNILEAREVTVSLETIKAQPVFDQPILGPQFNPTETFQ